jgi:hypothetical protein
MDMMFIFEHMVLIFFQFNYLIQYIHCTTIQFLFQKSYFGFETILLNVLKIMNGLQNILFIKLCI